MSDMSTSETKRFASTFITRAAKDWNSLPASVFPFDYNIAFEADTCIMDLTQDDGTDSHDELDIDYPLISVGVAAGCSQTCDSRLRRISVGSMKKTESVLLKEIKKQRLTEKKAAKKTANEMNKIYKPGECMKYMTIEAHPSLCDAWYMGDVAREVAAAGAKLLPVPTMCHPALLMWARTVPQTLDSAQGQIKLTPSRQACGRALLVTTAEQLAERVREHTLAAHLAQTRGLAACELTLVVFGVKDYFKSSRRKTSTSDRPRMTEIELELAVTDLLVSARCDTAFANTPNELALLIVQFTKAIAEEPYKKAKHACDEHAEFYMRGDNKKCVAVDKDGHGVGRLWQQMIAVLPLSSLETARALCAQYKSPIALYKALQSPDSVNEIANVGVSRAAVPGSRARRIGPEFARKLRTLFTAHDGNILID